MMMVPSFVRLRRMGGTNMRTWIRLLWTAAIVIAVAWPLLFWGKPAFPHRQDANVGTKQPMIQHVMPPRDLLW